ncbi:MAG: phosphoribosylaminoimidazolesuccinocarboxamide synthase [Adlercreutzia equolifaciens]
MYTTAAITRPKRGVIIADTKFEFGRLGNTRSSWPTRSLTPDSSRFWPGDTYEEDGRTSQLRQAVQSATGSPPTLGPHWQPAAPAPGHHRRAPARSTSRLTRKSRGELVRV